MNTKKNPRFEIFKSIRNEKSIIDCIKENVHDLSFLVPIVNDARLMHQLKKFSGKRTIIDPEPVVEDFVEAAHNLCVHKNPLSMRQFLKNYQIGTWIGISLNEIDEKHLKESLLEAPSGIDCVLNQLYLMKNGDIKAVSQAIGLQDQAVDENGVYYQIVANSNVFFSNNSKSQTLQDFENLPNAKTGVFNILMHSHWLTVVVSKSSRDFRTCVLHDSLGGLTEPLYDVKNKLSSFYNDRRFRLLFRTNPNCEQLDASSCGVRAIVNAKFYSQFSPFELTHEPSSELFGNLLPTNILFLRHGLRAYEPAATSLKKVSDDAENVPFAQKEHSNLAPSSNQIHMQLTPLDLKPTLPPRHSDIAFKRDIMHALNRTVMFQYHQIRKLYSTEPNYHQLLSDYIFRMQKLTTKLAKNIFVGELSLNFAVLCLEEKSKPIAEDVLKHHKKNFCETDPKTSSDSDEITKGSREKTDGSREKTKGSREKADGSREKTDGSREKADGSREKADGSREQTDGSRENLKNSHSAFLNFH